jgi:hypothetical protein
MGLKGLSEEDYLNLILEMNKYSYKNFPPFERWWVERNFIASQEAVAPAIQEYLYRNDILASGEAADFSASYADYLHYRLGIVHAFQSNQNDAIKQLEELIA